MRITYATLAKLIERMSESQRDSDVTVEIYHGCGSEYYPAELRIFEHNDVLDDYHPIIFVDTCNDIGERCFNVDDIANAIGLE